MLRGHAVMPNKGFECTGTRGTTPPPACGALWEVAQLGKCVRATPRQAAGGVAPGSAGLGLGPGYTEAPRAAPPKVDGTGT